MDQTGQTSDEERIEQELQRFVAKVRDAAAHTTSARRQSSPSRRGRRIAAAVVFVAAISATVVWRASLAWPAASRSGASQAIARASQTIADAFNSGVERLFGGTSAQVANTPAVDESRRKPVAHRKRNTQRSRPGDVVDWRPMPAGASPDPILQWTVLPSKAVLDLSLETLEVMAGPDTEVSAIYTPADHDVTPPVPLPPALGRIVTDMTATPGDMDVLVGQTGIVERVALLAPNRFEDRMLVSVMKNQRFKPAVVNGRAVRYLVRMRTRS